MDEKKPIALTKLKELLASNNTILKVIDIRSTEEYNKMHIAVAENIPVEMLDERSSSFNKEDTIVCVCNKGHERSQNAAALLASNGFKNIYYLEGGVLAWFAQ